MKKIDYAFIVHSRDRTDLPRRFPPLKYLPNYVFDLLTYYLPPFVVSKITGLVSKTDGKSLSGAIIGIPMTARQLLENREAAVRKIIDAVQLAKKHGAKYIGLGAMTASLSRGGKDIIDKVNNIHVTTGRTYTTKNITDYVNFCFKRFNLKRDKDIIGILGAAGGIGSSVAVSLARQQYKKMILIDLERKVKHLEDKIRIIESHAQELELHSSHKISNISPATLIVTATSSPEAILESRDIEAGTIIINDSQPTNISPDLMKRTDVLIIEGGVLHSPNMNCHLNLGLSHVDDIFSCLAEVLILAHSGSEGHYSIDDFDPFLYEIFSKISQSLGFRVCIQNCNGIINDEMLKEFSSHIRNRTKSFT